MNIENWNTTINFLESLPDEKFDMGVYHSLAECETVACVAGHIAVSLADPVEYEIPSMSSFLYVEDFSNEIDEKAMEIGKKYLGLDDLQAIHLFAAGFSTKWFTQVSRQEVIDFMKTVRDDPDHYFRNL